MTVCCTMSTSRLIIHAGNGSDDVRSALQPAGRRYLGCICILMALAAGLPWSWAAEVSAPHSGRDTSRDTGGDSGRDSSTAVAEWLDGHWQGPMLGQRLAEAEVDALPGHVFVDGNGLPDGRGFASDGAVIYAEQCADCHGSTGQGGRALELTGDRSLLDTP